MTELILIRHGETHWNIEKRFQGTADSPLTPAGEGQARLLAKRVARLNPAALYSSDLGRAALTAGIIAEACVLPVIEDTDLRERNVGVLTGLTFEVIRDDHGHIWKQYFEHEYVIPEGESLQSVVDRGEKFLTRIAEDHSGELGDTSHLEAKSAVFDEVQ